MGDNYYGKKKSKPLRRKVDRRDIRRSFLILCEGERTEPNYFSGFRAKADVVAEGTGHNTVSIVKMAIQRKKDLEKEERDKKEPRRYDEIWCVFDKDSFSNEQFNRAIEMGKENGIGCAYSNESFELWFLLHFNYYDVAITRQDYCDKLTGLLGCKYEKNMKDMFEILESRMNQAIRNAETLLNSYEQKNPSQNNPSTTVHLLVQKLIFK